MKRYIKYPLIGFGILFILVVVFILLVICGVFRHEPRFVCGTYFEQQLTENKPSYPEDENNDSCEWIEEPDYASRVPNSILHRQLHIEDDGYIREFNSKGSQNFYYNGRHGFYVLLPKGMGYLQQGEPQLGAHHNVFYNTDTTLIISCGAMFYDVLLVDHPHWEDTLRNMHIKDLNDKGKVRFLSKKPNEIVAKVFIDGNNTQNPPSDYLLSKWILKKISVRGNVT